MSSSPWPFWIAGGVLVVGGLALLLWAALADRARGRRRCPRCWYDMAGLTGLTCPECGREAAAPGELGRTRRHRRRGAAGLATIAAGLATCSFPRVERDGWVSMVPPPALRVLARTFGRSESSQYALLVRPGIAPPPLTSWQRAVAANEAAGDLIQIADADDVRGVAAALPVLSVIASLYPESRLAAPELRRFLTYRCVRLSGGVRAVALYTLDRLDPAGAPGRYADMVRTDPDPEWRTWALPEVIRSARPRRRAVGDLVAALRDEDPRVRREAAAMLAWLGPAAVAAEGELKERSEMETDDAARSAMEEALAAVRR